MGHNIKIDCKSVHVETSRYSDYMTAELEDFEVAYIIKDLIEEVSNIDEITEPILENFTSDVLDLIGVEAILEYLEDHHDIKVEEAE